MLFTSRRGLIVVAAVSVAAVAAASALAIPGASRRAARARPSACPRNPVDGPNLGTAAYAAAVKAIHAQIPRVFDNVRTQGAPAWQHAQISALVTANGIPPSPGGRLALKGVGRYGKIAAQACGRAVADSSLVAFLYFPECQIPCASAVGYVTRTRRGWRLWAVER